MHGARIICDAAIEIGDYALISWNVVLMDSYRVPFDPAGAPAQLARVPRRRSRGGSTAAVPARPIRIGRNVWIGFEAACCPA